MRKYIRAFVILLLAGILFQAPAKVSADDNVVTGTCGEGTTWTFYKSSGELELSGAGSVDTEGWKEYRDKIQSVYIGKGITSIQMKLMGAGSSYVSLGPCDEVISYNVSINNKNFSALDGVLFNKDQTILLKYPRRKESNAYSVPTSVKEIASYAFYNVQKLTELNIPGNVRTIASDGVYDCEHLQSVYLSEGLQTIGERAFYSSLSLKSITIPKSVQTIDGWAFWACGWEGWPGLQEVKILGSNTKLGDSVFYKCISLKRVETAADIAYREFDGCTALEEVVLQNSVKSIAGMAFDGCSSLKKLSIPDSVIDLTGFSLAWADNLGTITVSIGNKNFCVEDGILFNKNKTRLIKYPGTKKEAKSYKIPLTVTEIDPYAFYKCTTLESVEMHKNIQKLGSYEFADCSNLKYVVVPGGISDISGVFAGCSNLEYVVLPKSITNTGSYIASTWAFDYCPSNLKVYLYSEAEKNIYAPSTAEIHYLDQGVRLSFDTCGGSTSIADKTVYPCYTYGALGTPARTGCRFVGWYTAASGGEQVNADTLVSKITDHKLYAHWTPVSYTVTYHANGGKVSTASKPVSYGSTYGTLPTPVRTGYQFTGWYTAKKGGTQIKADSVMKQTKGQTIYAQWKAKTYIVTYRANGGKTSASSKKVTYGSTYGKLAAPSRSGYQFTGWYTAKSGGTKITAKSKVKTAKNHTLYAHWKMKPPAGVSVKVKLKSVNAVTVSWKKISGAKGYEVYRSASAKGKYKRCKVLASAGSTSYTDKHLTGGRTYYYKVRAYKTSGKKKLYGAYSKAGKKLVKGALSTPKLERPSKFKIGEPMKLQWNRIRNADKLDIYCGKNGGRYQKIKTVRGSSVQTSIPTEKYDFKKGNTYRFRIRAYYKTDGVTIYSSYSNSWAIGRK